MFIFNRKVKLIRRVGGDLSILNPIVSLPVYTVGET
jgi:hypothetical protein